MDVRYLLLLFLLVSCLPTAQVSKGNLASDGTSQSTGGTTSGTTTIPASVTQWNYLGALSKTITINVSNLNNSYILGKDIETFLTTPANFSQDYCLISRYSIAGLTYELRSRIIPISYYDFSAKRTVKIFRVDFNDLNNSKSTCIENSASPIGIEMIDVNGDHVLDPNSIVAARKTYDPSLICPLCSSVLSSSKIFIAKKSLGVLKELTLAENDIRTLALSIDPNNNSSTNAGSCSQTECATRGFDCCLDNQCITDGATRPTASTQYSSQLQAAEQERLNNPLAYLNYPQLYYICGTSIPSTTGGSSSGSYDQGLTQLKKDYFCLKHLTTNKTGATFHQDVLNGFASLPDELDIADVLNSPATLYPIDIECRNDAAPSSNMYYKKVVERLYQNCGCAKTTLSDMITYCPAYDYTVNYFETSGLPNRIDCYTPPNTANQIPTQQTVSVNSRSAPHRYFRSCGEEFGSTGACASGDSQEGDFFEYQDEGNILPSQEQFGMNSILGQMKVTLDKTVPAKSIAIELDQIYQISTTSGFYSPCPTCAKDSWFTSFSAYPTTAYGTGLQAIGHSTSRDLYDNNSTGGNYEDTIFGRACWIPPTMIPFSHSPISSTQTQRLTRLKTQAALFANGYQRDWYGFNKGALIGSFDGVSWFAVGKGRIVRSTSKKLFLAINAPFADLASPTLQVVNVQAYDGVSQAAQLDYDPTLHLYHPYQNEAGNCQANHMCDTDTDCVTRLGWEYMCASVQDVKTQWPKFDVDAKEKAGLTDILTIDQVLNQKRFPSASTKRCVYRGAGSLCIPNSGTVTDLNKRKTLTCAPNFYCANINTSGSVFNSKVSRYASNLEDIPVARNHYFGKDANVLGRPLSYVASSLTTSLPSDVKANLTQNMLQYEASASSTTGICLPGKALPEASNQATMFNPYEQHKNADSQGRTDFISQIGGCNSGLFTSYRYSSCPVFNSTGDYEFLSSTYATLNYPIRARNQNSCGLDSLLSTATLSSTADALLPYSPFRTIESKTLSTQTVIEPSLARDACLRRAGQVCHTDLDCGPNKMHADQTENFSLAYFGNEAEKKYHQEYLVCGQGDAKPSPFDTVGYKAFSMSKNRCCREVGSDLTTFTSYIPLKVQPVSSTDYNATSYDLKMTLAPGISPKDPLRYSRLATVENLGSADRPPLNAYQTRSGSSLNFAQTANVMTPYQWKTLGEANSEGCCGGGWVRKFSDGGNDWTRRDRLYMDMKNFACINSRTSLLTHPEDYAFQYDSIGDVTTLVNQDLGDYCKDATGMKGSCAQYSISNSSVDTGPQADSPQFVSNHIKTNGMVFSEDNYKDFYFYPRSADGNPEVIMDFTSATGRRNIEIKLPSYYPRSAFDYHYAVKKTFATYADRRDGFGAGYGGIWRSVVMLYDLTDISLSGNIAYCTIPTGAQLTALEGLSNPLENNVSGTYCPSTESCCHSYNPATRILKVITGNPASGLWAGKKMGLKISLGYPAGGGTSLRTKPGTSTHYLKRLGLLELSGIPQVTYKPIMCNDNGDRLVPGVFKKPLGVTDMKSVHFNDPSISFYDSTYSSNFTNAKGLDHEPVFSENDFKCCTPLGKNTTDKTKCCSGYGNATPSGTIFTCALPVGADLMVYFNRFVTNEGRGTDQPGGGLLDEDFDNLTGEPIISVTVSQKISILGKTYCSSGKVRQGGTFGSFNLEPSGSDTNQNEKIYGIVDSPNDEAAVAGGGASAGYTAFMSGFRWNHHLYCDE